jgi:hypothetical protein
MEQCEIDLGIPPWQVLYIVNHERVAGDVNPVPRSSRADLEVELAPHDVGLNVVGKRRSMSTGSRGHCELGRGDANRNRLPRLKALDIL